VQPFQLLIYLANLDKEDLMLVKLAKQLMTDVLQVVLMFQMRVSMALHGSHMLNTLQLAI